MRKSKNRYFYHIFVSPGDAPGAITQNIARMKRQFSACQTSRSMYPSIFIEQFPSYSNHKCKKSLFSCTAAHIFVSPGDAPAIITQYVAWTERQLFNACQPPCSIYLSIFNSFPVIQSASAKNRRFTYRSLHFCFPWRRPCDYHAICCMDGKTIQCLPNPSQHVPIYLQ